MYIPLYCLNCNTGLGINFFGQFKKRGLACLGLAPNGMVYPYLLTLPLLLTGTHFCCDPGGWGATPLYALYRYVGLKGYGFSAILVINKVWILATFVLNRVRVLYSSLELGNVV